MTHRKNRELEAEVTRLQSALDEALKRLEALDDALAGAQHARDEAREESRHAELNMQSSARAWQAEVTRLTEALAAAEDRVRHECSVSKAAEARVRELDAELERYARGAAVEAELSCPPTTR